VGTVGIELKATLKTRKLLIPLNAKNAKNIKLAQLRYTPGTRTAMPEIITLSISSAISRRV